ncbi:MAG: hypothetical protein JSS02_23610, partial [Planctomycetes bacterium]|nr:hypothetical protein [Planctomycetota bacterium]
TYCRLDETSCVFLVHVPDLRKFNNDAKNQLGELAWETAQLVVRTNGKSTPRKLAVGIRGVVLYDRAMIGSLQAADSPENGIEISKEGTLSQQALYRFFAPPPRDNTTSPDSETESDLESEATTPAETSDENAPPATQTPNE